MSDTTSTSFWMTTVIGAFLLNVLAGITSTCVVWLVLALCQAIAKLTPYFWDFVQFLRSIPITIVVKQGSCTNRCGSGSMCEDVCVEMQGQTQAFPWTSSSH